LHFSLCNSRPHRGHQRQYSPVTGFEAGPDAAADSDDELMGVFFPAVTKFLLSDKGSRVKPLATKKNPVILNRAAPKVLNESLAKMKLCRRNP
jgi:hypothetical protein